MSKGRVFVGVMVAVALMSAVTAWDSDLDNLSTVEKHISPKPFLPAKGVRRSIYEKFFADQSTNNPFLNQPLQTDWNSDSPLLSENDYVLGEDYEEDPRDLVWFHQQRPHNKQHQSQQQQQQQQQQHHQQEEQHQQSQQKHHLRQLHRYQQPQQHQQRMQHHHHQQHLQRGNTNNGGIVKDHQTPSLDRLEHMLEEELGSSHVTSDGPRNENDEMEILHESRRPLAGLNFDAFPIAGEVSTQHGGHANRPQLLSELGDGRFPHAGDSVHPIHLNTAQQQPNGDPQEQQQQATVQQLLTSPVQFPHDFVGHEQISRVLENPRSRFSTQVFSPQNQFSNLEDDESFRSNLLQQPILAQDFGSDDLGNQRLQHIQVPNPVFEEPLDTLENQGLYPNRGHFGDFTSHSFENPSTFAQEGGPPDWPSSPRDGVSLPSSKDLITAFEHPEMTKEGQRGIRAIRSSVLHPEACHARNLHICGTRVINEFTYQPDYPEKCRIREEFLDCMEKRRQHRCELEGERLSRDGTKLIRDKVKTLLWSARGCILGFSA